MGASPLFRRAPRRPWRPERLSHPSEATGGLPAAVPARAGHGGGTVEPAASRRGARRNRGVARQNRALPTATVPGKAGHGGIGSPPVRGHRQNFTKALRAAGRPPVASRGWLGLSGRHGRRGARRNRGVARWNRALPARDHARKGWARLGHGGIGSPPLRGHRQNFRKALRAAERPPVASGGWLGLSGRHGRRVARRNKGVAR